MQDFLYNSIKDKCGGKAEILLTDTDSLMYKIDVENVYEDFSKNKELFDFSNYSKDSDYFDNSNNLVLGKMKDETCRMPKERFAVLKAKVHTFITEYNHVSKKAKCINRNAVDNELKYEYYKNILFKRPYMRHKMNTIQGKDHIIETYRIKKINNFFLSFNYDKTIYLKMHIVDYHIFINLLVNHNFVEYNFVE